MLLAVAISVCACATGCEKQASTQVIVELHAEPGVRSAAKTIRVEVDNEEGKTVLTRDKAVDGSSAKLARIPLIPKGGDPTRRFRVRATLLAADGTTEVSKLEARSGYLENELTELELWFHDACEGKDCGGGRTCHHGLCLGSCFTPGATGPATPECGECEVCGDACTRQSGLSCGCPGETCNGGGACEPLVRVATAGAGFSHTCAAVESNPHSTFCWGATTLSSGEKGRLGTGAQGEDSPGPVLVPGLLAREGIAAGSDHTCAVSFGLRTCFGANHHGQLGGDIGVVVPNPHTFPEPYHFKPVASGFLHTCALDKSGQIYCWGDNTVGSAGLGTISASVAVPTPILSPGVPGGFRSVDAGGYHTCGLAQSGELYCWGLNESAELGVPSSPPKSGGSLHSPTLVRPGCEPGNTQTACFDDYEHLGTGAFHTCAIRKSGELYCFGGNKYGQLGLGWSATDESEPSRVPGSQTWSAVAGGNSYSCALTAGTTKELWCWGLNYDGELGIPSVAAVYTPTRVPVAAPGGWSALALGRHHGCAIRDDGTLWCWGRNKEGQVGIGKATEEPVPPTRVCFPG